MATDIDIIRKEYWEYMKRTFKSKFPIDWMSLLGHWYYGDNEGCKRMLYKKKKDWIKNNNFQIFKDVSWEMLKTVVNLGSTFLMSSKKHACIILHEKYSQFALIFISQ